MASLVLPPGSSSNLAVSKLTCPFSGSPSNSKVSMSLSGGRTSWFTPGNPNELPFSSVCVSRHIPPDLGSNFSRFILYFLGPSHCTYSFGSMNALKTSTRGASNSRTMKSSCFPGSAVTFVLFLAIQSPPFLLDRSSFLRLQHLVQLLESLVPVICRSVNPVFDLVHRVGVEAVYSFLSALFQTHQICFA